MHELPVVKEVLSAALEYARQENAREIVSVTLCIGQLHDLVPECVEKFFRYAGRGTIAQDAKLTIERPPVICRCGGCGEHFVLHPHDSGGWQCPVCRGDRFAILTGREFSIENIGVRV